MVSLSYLYAGTQVVAGFRAVAGVPVVAGFPDVPGDPVLSGCQLLLIAGAPYCGRHLQPIRIVSLLCVKVSSALGRNNAKL